MLPNGNRFRYQTTRFEISDASQIGETRRFANQLCQDLDFDEVSAGRATIVLTEIASNLLKHARSGEILLQADRTAGQESLVILGLDRGPGLKDVNLCFTDGYSTTATSGTGLGAVRRQSDQCDLYTSEKGTAILSIIQRNRTDQPSDFFFGGFCVALKGETVSGDGWLCRELDHRKLILVADGLGHGLMAHEAATSALEVLEEASHADVDRLMQDAHLRLKSTRGAAVAMTSLDLKTGDINYLSIGNIRTAILTGTETRTLLSHSGTIGLQFRRSQSQTARLLRDSRILMHSDGLLQRWDLKAYPGLTQRHPALICGVLFRDFTRGTDDTTILAGGWIS